MNEDNDWFFEKFGPFSAWVRDPSNPELTEQTAVYFTESGEPAAAEKVRQRHAAFKKGQHFFVDDSYFFDGVTHYPCSCGQLFPHPILVEDHRRAETARAGSTG